VRAAIGSVAASTSPSVAGAATASSAGRLTSSCSTPGSGTPSVRWLRCSGVGTPSIQPWV
jgi:hypothetical protein